MSVKAYLVFKEFIAAAVEADQARYEQFKVMILSMNKGGSLELPLKQLFDIADSRRTPLIGAKG